MSNMNNNLEHIPQEKFEFVQKDARLHDKRLETKARSFFQDAMLRFSKNKSSVVAAWILLFLVVFSLLSPIISPYTIDDQDPLYVNYPAYVPAIAKLEWGILDGAKIHDSQNEDAMNRWKGIAIETGMDPVLNVVDSHATQVKKRGQWITRYTYDLEVNRYLELGIEYKTLTFEEFEKIQAYQDEHDIQIIYPWVEYDAINRVDDADIWYQCDAKGLAKLDADGNFVPVYSSRQSIAGAEYHSKRIEGDDGSYIYSFSVGGGVRVRLSYYNYYIYRNGMEPTYVFGTTNFGQDLFSAIGVGARFSLIFAIIISAINMFIGAVYGAVQGYYGGTIDMVLDRFSDILSGVPFIVVTTLFQLHVAPKLDPSYGVIVALILTFIVTGWIGMAALTRKQFYRFKSQEFVMAARTLGASDRRLMFKHIFPNAIGTIITSCALIIPGVISSETSLTYLGIVDMQATVGTTIGTLLSQGNATFITAPHTMLWPSLFLGLLMICFNLFGNGLRDAFNPTTRGAGD